mgnify:CR=1 FL=1
MHIAILGAGRVGTTLGRRFTEAGHSVTYGVRTPDDAKHAGLRVADMADACAHAELVLLCTPWAAAESAITAAGDLRGKVLVDATNPIGPGMVLTHGTTDSGAEQVARWATGARVVKAFNSVGMEVMADPVFGTQRAALAIAGDEDDACATVAALATAIGFEPIRLGPLSRARFIEPAALVWITAAPVLGTRQFAYGLLRR